MMELGAPPMIAIGYRLIKDRPLRSSDERRTGLLHFTLVLLHHAMLAAF
jgi:hypothetical protein